MASDVRPLPVAEDEFETYDVFMSHRGPDTKRVFVSFLYDALKAAGLRPFLDCKSFDKGQPSWKCIEHSIRTAPIALVIFSESFARSEWCLKELHVMLESPSVKVLPIFYKVRPWEVRRPESGRLKDGFRELEARCSEADVEQWRADLRNASELMGWEFSDADIRLEGDLVSEVVGKVFELANKSLPLNVGDYVVGVKEKAEGIIHTLDNQKNILIVGLWGMGGIGKSTLARELYNQLSKRFSARCYVEDVRNKVINGGEEKVQNCILKDLCTDELEKIEGRSRGKTILEERLCKKRILLVLDDVSHGNHVNYMISRRMLADGSLCILTSRDKRVFEELTLFDFRREIYIHDVQLLSYEDSKQVFTSHAFGGEFKMRQRFEELASDISLACCGVPLVLKICGAHLKEEDNVDYWEEVLMKLKCGDIMGQNNEIFECLRISYDVLPFEHQEIFLDIACCLLGQLEDMAMRIWKYQGWAIRNLKKKALIIVDNKGCFAMHDHLRDMGRKISREGICKRLWLPESLSILKHNEALPNTLQTLIISNNSSNQSYTDGVVLDLHLLHMKELRILICDNTINVMSLPKSVLWFQWQKHKREHSLQDQNDGLLCQDMNIFSIVPKDNKLVVLVTDFMFHSFESVGEKVCFENLQILHYRNCEHPQMSIGDELLHSKDLEVIDLSYCRNLQKLPQSFGALSNLEVLNLSLSNKLNNLPESFGGLKKLQNLNLACSGIGSLPDSFGDLCNLELVTLSWCEQLITLPKSFGRLCKLRNLDLTGSGIGSLPESLGDLCNLEGLNLSKCRKLKTLPESLGGLQNLQDLDLTGSGIGSLPESVGELCNLEVLTLLRCELISLPESFGGLKKLQGLNLAKFDIESLPESLGDLRNLEKLSVWGCRKLGTLPESLGGLQNLQDLNLTGSGIRSLPESVGELCNLKVLTLLRCQKLKTLPESLGGLQNLQDLNLTGSGIRSLPESVGELCNLEVLTLSRCKQLITVPMSFGRLCKLRKLDLWGCRKLNTLPESLGGLQNLQNLNLTGSGIRSLPESVGELCNLKVLTLLRCQKLKTLPESLGGLQNLQYLNLTGSGIRSLPETFSDLCNLEVVTLSRCKQLITVPMSFGRLCKLRKLDLAGSRIGSLPESLGDLCNLEKLSVWGCRKLNTLPDSLGGLQNLQNLNLTGSGIRSLPESVGELCNLEVLTLSRCKQLIAVPMSFGRLCKLRKLDLAGSRIRSLPESVGELCNLEVLSLRECQLLVSLPESFGRLCKLRNLNLTSSGIESLPESFGELRNLEVLDVWGCWELNMVPESFGSLHKLWNLDLPGCGIENLPERFEKLCNLETFHLGDCEMKLKDLTRV